MRTTIKKVVVLDGEVINVGELEELPEGAIVEEREMQYTPEYGWREVGWRPPISEIDKLKITQAEQFEAILSLLGGM